jgi:CO/xanthine dehydrogenase FAD-binding subunit
MQPFECIRATDAQHAVELLARYGPTARLLAGGTDLLVDLKTANRGPGVVIDISRARDMKRLELSDDRLVIGAMVTHGEIVRSQLVRKLCPALAEAARSVGAAQTRNLGTIGGNLANAVPSMDTGPALLALDAQIAIARSSGSSRMPLAAFFVGPRKTVLGPEELILEVSVPAESFGKPMAFLKFGLRKGQALALVNAAAGFFVHGSRPAFHDVRIALGAVAPVVIRAAAAERYLEGRTIDLHAMATAGVIAADEAAPISDFRASATYRRDLIAVLTRRALESAWQRAQPAVRTQDA